MIHEWRGEGNMGQSAQQVSFIELNKICKRGDRGVEEGDELRRVKMENEWEVSGMHPP